MEHGESFKVRLGTLGRAFPGRQMTTTSCPTWNSSSDNERGRGILVGVSEFAFGSWDKTPTKSNSGRKGFELFPKTAHCKQEQRQEPRRRKRRIHLASRLTQPSFLISFLCVGVFCLRVCLCRCAFSTRGGRRGYQISRN